MKKSGINTKDTHHGPRIIRGPKKYFEEIDMHFQLVPPHMYQRNAAERALRTLKDHFIDALCTVQPKLPFYLWD